ncbi:MAG: hypothetical protein IKW03_09220 [Clostridia bacterium]|nr:hypothetical protein [Clostridia bacterium]
MKKTTKAIISFVLSMLIAFSSMSVIGVFAADECDCGHTPMVMVSGFGATTLIKVNDDGTEEVAFPFDANCVTGAVTRNIGKFNKEAPLDFVKALLVDLIDPIRMNPDGTSYYNLRPVYETVEDTCLAGFKKNDALKYVPYTGSDFLDMERIGKKIGDDHVFNFMYDWRLSGDMLADLFDEYIEDVLEYTGHDRVDIYCLSQGSVPVAQYLYKYSEKAQVEDLVFDNPIVEGSNFVSDLLAPKDEVIKLDFESILDLLEGILHIETDISEIIAVLGMIPSDFDIHGVIDYAAKDLIYPIAKDSPAYIEMIIPEEYDRVVADYFSNPGNEKLLAEADKVRKGYMADVKGTFEKAAENGIEVSIISHTGIDLVTATKTLSDGIVDLSTSCGAYCSPDGTPFPSDYIQKVDNGKNCISPDRTVDLSCGYIPERTWIIDGLWHGMIEWAPNSLGLLETLFYTDTLKDAWSSAKYPQFMQSNDSNSDLYMYFTSTNSLYEVVNGKGQLVIENVSKENTMLVENVEIRGVNGKTDIPVPVNLAPGEKFTVTVNTKATGFGEIFITYIESDNYIKTKTKTEAFSVTDNYSGQLADVKVETVAENGIFALVMKIILIIINLFRNSLFGQAV